MEVEDFHDQTGVVGKFNVNSGLLILVSFFMSPTIYLVVLFPIASPTKAPFGTHQSLASS